MADTTDTGAWNVDMEVNLFHAMRGHKPVGVNRHFNMVFIHDKLSNAANKKLTAKSIWNHLSSMYDLQALNESEILPFPNKAVDFQLPYSEHKEYSEDAFPRMQNLQGTPAAEDVKAKPEGQAKGGKASRSDSKTSQSSKSDSRASSASSETKSTHSSKSDKGGGTPSGQGKGGGKSYHGSAAHSTAFTPDPSPKRGKRTRNAQSASNSPATPSDTPTSSKRRR
ncbi:hypothetical protein BaRGS_00000576 [Batillaria attramentaria]|uniref:Uncharacterized protein n=1 Tax=Batillaria attramentaria TaxID=370345 RepID=A0ABD0M9B3_9CAEN